MGPKLLIFLLPLSSPSLVSFCSCSAHRQVKQNWRSLRHRDQEEGEMGSLLGGWPSYNPHNFSQLRPADPSAQPSNVMPVTYVATHGTDPPPSQVITTESRNILLRHLYQKSEERLRPKRAAPESISPQHTCKQQRGPVADGGGS